MDYPVPNFGEDHEIIASKKHLNAMELKYGEWKYPGPKAKGPPQNYFVPNFGVDEDIKASLKNLNEQEKKHGEWKLPDTDNVQLQQQSIPACDSFSCQTETAAPHKLPKTQQWAMNYPVPNFGEDQEIIASKKHLNDMELKYGEWKYPGPKAKGPPQNYFVPNFGVDEDIKVSLKNLNSQEAIHGEWKLPDSVATQLEESSDPVCSSAGCTQYLHPNEKPKYPIDYPVANHGPDHDISVT